MGENPYSEGTAVVFMPDKRTTGWHQHSFERWGLIPGQEYKVSAVRGDKVEVNGNPEATMHWSQFKPAATVSEEEREHAAAEFRRKQK